jgi:integrase/recombinase XerC
MCPAHAAATLAEAYDLGLHYMREKHLPPGTPHPHPTKDWPKENLEFLERYQAWLLQGGVSEHVTRLYHVKMAGHVFGLTLKRYDELDPDADLDCALQYVQAKGLSISWIKNCCLALAMLRRYLRLERGLGEETKVTPFDVSAHTQGLPVWLASELERYQKVLQRNWRSARLDLNLRGFWSKQGSLWRFLSTEHGVQELADLKRQHVLDYLDQRLAAGVSAHTVNAELRQFHSFLLFLQGEGYAVPNSLLRIPGLKPPEPLPKYLTDEQVRLLRDELEQAVQTAILASKRRIALLDRAAFYLLWQGGLRLGELEELRLEDLDLGHKRLSVRDGKLRKDRTVYLADGAIGALQDYLAVRGGGTPGRTDHVFLYRHVPLKKDLIRARLKAAGERVGVKVYPHRLRHTCATQLLNAGCRITSIQRFLGHKKLNTTMIYARAHDQTVADDYFAAMQRVEQRLEIIPEADHERNDEVVKVLGQAQLLEWAVQLAKPELQLDARLDIAEHLLNWLKSPAAHSLPEEVIAEPLVA